MKINFENKCNKNEYENGDVLIIELESGSIIYSMFIETGDRDDYLFNLEDGSLFAIGGFALSLEEIYGDNYKILEVVNFNNLIISRG